MRSILLKYKEKCFPLIDQVIVSGGNFSIGILLARTLGLDRYGEFALIWLVVLFCSSLHHAWMISPMYTFFPQLQKQQQQCYLSALLIHQLFFSVLATLFVCIIMQVVGNAMLGFSITEFLPYIAFAVFNYLMYDFLRRLFYVQRKIQKVIALDAVVFGIQVLGIFILSLQTTFSLAVVLGLIGGAYGMALFFGFSLLKVFKWNKFAFIELAISHWKFSKWLLATALLQWFSGNFFIVAAASLLSPLAVGTIRIMQNIIGLLHVLFLAIENYVPIRAAQIFKTNGIQQLGVFLRQVTLKGGVITLILAGTIAFFGEEIVQLLYTEAYIDQAYLLYGFAFLYLLVFIGTTYRFAIRTLEQTRSIFIAYLWSTAFSLLTAKLIIESFGIEGVIVGLVGTQLIMQLYFIYSLRTKLNLLWR